MIVDPSAATAAEVGRPAGAAAGETLGKYRLDRVLGAGGMGVVWAAFDPDLERNVALKLLHASDVVTLRSRLLREARAMARLKHPNVLTVYEVGTDRNRDYIAMEMVDGETLDAWLATKPPRAEIIDALVAAGRGLHAAHLAGLVHRDFKPHNVLRSTDGHVYVTDFGLARGNIEDGSDVVTGGGPVDLLSSPLTQTGVMIGTPAYMAPEQFAGRVPDARTDQFAFCITAWEALTGARPFTGESLPELEKAASSGVRGLIVDLPAPLRAVLERGLEPAPDARWPDLRALLDALVAATAPAKARKRRVALVAIGALVVAGGGGFAIYRATRGSAATDDCVSADAAFDPAWSAARRDAIVRTNPGGDVIAPLVLLDDLRRTWVRSYTATCAAPRTEARGDRLRCLRAVRDEVARTTTPLVGSKPDFNVTAIVMLTASLQSCTGEHEGRKAYVLPDPPDPPDLEPPAPPAPR